MSVAKQIAAIILKEYGEADDRVGEQLEPLTQGDEEVARQCFLLMAAVHIQGAMAHMQSAGLNREQIAEMLYSYADQKATPILPG